MAVDYYPANSETREMVKKIVFAHHPDIAPIVDGVVVMFRDTPIRENGVAIPFQVKKVPPILRGFPGVNPTAQFIIILSAGMWDNAMESERKAWLDSALCACSAEENDDGEIKTKIRKPDTWGYRDAIQRHGHLAIFPPIQDDQDEDVSEVISTVEDVVDSPKPE